MPAVRALCILLLALLLPLPAAAWNSAGHRLIAAVAWDQLDEQTRFAVTELLRQHPDYERWLKNDNKDGNAGRTAFIEASTWPDEIRRMNAFDPGDEPTPTPPGFPDTAAS